MVVRKLSISLSFELADVLRSLAKERSEDVSGLLEVLLREHRLVATAIQEHRERQWRPPPRAPDY
jgi:hypothetical protein